MSAVHHITVKASEIYSLTSLRSTKIPISVHHGFNNNESDGIGALMVE